MIPRAPDPFEDGFDDLDLGPGPYDAAAATGDDWEGSPEAPDPPFGRAAGGEAGAHRILTEWRSAQGDQAADLAETACKYGQLAERLRAGPGGGRRELALREAADLGWWAGVHIGLDRLVLASEDRLSGVQDDALDLTALLWSVRRLTQPQGVGQDAVALAAFLGRARRPGDPGPEFLQAEAALRAGSDLHPVVRGAMAFHLWRATGPGGLVRDLEAAVLGSRIAGDPGRGSGFLPLALSSGVGLRASGPVPVRLQAWLRGAGQATEAALLHLDRLSNWRLRATGALAGLSGRTPAKLAEVFGNWPVVSAPLAEKETAASRAAVQRNLDVLAEKGLIREMTGQGRYRLWTARL